LKSASIRVWIRSHAANPFRTQSPEGRNKCAGFVKELLRLIAPHPIFQQFQMLRIFCGVCDRDLVGAPGTFQFMAIDSAGCSPAFRGPEHAHWPAAKGRFLCCASFALDRVDFFDAFVQRSGHGLVHAALFGAFHKVRSVAVTEEKMLQVLMGDTGKPSVRETGKMPILHCFTRHSGWADDSRDLSELALRSSTPAPSRCRRSCRAGPGQFGHELPLQDKSYCRCADSCARHLRYFARFVASVKPTALQSLKRSLCVNAESLLPGEHSAREFSHSLVSIRSLEEQLACTIIRIRRKNKAA